MDNPLIYKLLEEIRLQFRFAQFAWKELPRTIQMNDPERAFFLVHAFLEHGANISKMLWPDSPNARERGERLRTELQITDDSPLALRELRPLLDHFDERLEEWAATSEHRNFVAINMMPIGTLAGFKEDVFHRSLDPETYGVSFEGVPCDLRQLWKELQRLELAAQTWLKTHNPW